MSYTWEEVMLGIDVKAESKKKAEEQRKIQAEQERENRLGAAWSFGLSILGYALGGPLWGFLGKQAGKYGADIAVPWETMTVEEGKFDRAETREFNKTIKEAADDQTTGQMVNTLVDLGTAYIQSGGLTAEPGEWDPTTFGSGEDAWTLRGRGTPATQFDPGSLSEVELSKLYKSGVNLTPTGQAMTPASDDFVQSLWNRDAALFSNIGQTGEKLGTAYGQGQTLDFLYEHILGQQKQKERKQG